MKLVALLCVVSACGRIGFQARTTGDDGSGDGNGANDGQAIGDGPLATASETYVKASNNVSGLDFGWSLALSADGNTLAVGALNESTTANFSGAVYVYVRAGTMWSEQAFLKASNPNASDAFGGSVALSDDGNTLA